MINTFQPLLHHVRYSCVFIILFALSVAAQAAVNLVVPTPNYTGSYIISWTGAGYYSYLRQYKSTGDITLIYGSQSGSYNATNPAGIYYYYVVSCPSPSQTGCQNSPQIAMEVKLAAAPTPAPIPTPTPTPTPTIAVIITFTPPTLNISGNYIISWSGAGYHSTLYQYKSSGDIALAYGSNSGSFNASNTAGTYYYYVVACPSPNNTGCITSQQKAMVISPAPTPAPTPVPTSAPTPPPIVGEAYEYDVLGRLTKVKMDGVVKTIYNYDKAGNRTNVTE